MQNPILCRFVEHCRQWYAYHPQRDHCCEARQDAYAALVQRHGADSVRRHVRLIRAALDRAEAAVRTATTTPESETMTGSCERTRARLLREATYEHACQAPYGP